MQRIVTLGDVCAGERRLRLMDMDPPPEDLDTVVMRLVGKFTNSLLEF